MSVHVPSYRRHKQSGQAVVTLSDGFGGRRDVLLGKYGTATSKAEYRRVVLDWEANGRRLPGRQDSAELTVTELIDRYWPWVQEYYRHADGTPTSEVENFVHTLRPLKYIHGKTAVKDFGPAALKAVRELLIRGYEHPKYGPQKPLCRNEVNKRIKRIRRMVKWAVENELVPAAVLHGLQAVLPLKRGRSEARESEPVLPIARAVVMDTVALLRPMQRDMVLLQLESGMRPGELVSLRACDLDMTGPVWLYRPERHKTEHHGHERTIVLGPRAQAIVKNHLTAKIDAYLFSPARNMEERRAALRARRKTPVQPSQQDRSKKRPKKRHGDRYSVKVYARFIRDAILRHNAGKPESEHIPHWHPHQLRHTRALELKREFGLDVARAVLGHRSPVISEHYAGLDVAKAAEAMAKLG